MSSDLNRPIFARLYTRLSNVMEDRGTAEHRERLLAGSAGRVVEIGCGNGLNFAHYPETVEEVVAVEPEDYLRSRATEAAPEAAVPITVVQGVAGGLPAEDESFDVAVTSLVLCSVPDQRAALDEVKRVLKRGGELRFYEHVAAAERALRVTQLALDATLYPRLSGNCHLHRDTVEAIRSTGFVVHELSRFRFPDRGVGRWLGAPVTPHVLGRATLGG